MPEWYVADYKYDSVATFAMCNDSGTVVCVNYGIIGGCFISSTTSGLISFKLLIHCQKN
jgi:hypothetical protein